jgi:ABC-type polysaccharide/polyol phosphate export permease
VQKVDLYLSNSLSVMLGSLFNIMGYIIIALIFGIHFSPNALGIVLLLLNVALLGIGTSMILSIIYIFLKDIHHILDIFILLGFWSSGIFFKGEVIISKVPEFVYINPFLGIISNMRNAMLFDQSPNWTYMAIGFAWGTLLLVIGLILVNKYSHLSIERT